ncbi:MAG: hypothetical protein JSS36_01235 [Proteobacteria bacterium]|nr:hypothetical protein [Pseudomonadota bacterium]
MVEAADTYCSPDRLDTLVASLRQDGALGLQALDESLRQWPLDPRLHFLRGSVLAGLQRYDEGRADMARAVEIAPDFALARFQLGFLDLTSGRPMDALGVWSALGALPPEAPLRIFAEGLASLAADDFPEARRQLERGMALNHEHPLVNADMQLIVDEIDKRAAAAMPAGKSGVDVAAADGASSAVDMLLRQSRLRESNRRLN